MLAVFESSVDVCLFVRNQMAPAKARVPVSCQDLVTMETLLHPAVWQFPNDFRALQPRPVRARSVGVPPLLAALATGLVCLGWRSKRACVATM